VQVIGKFKSYKVLFFALIILVLFAFNGCKNYLQVAYEVSITIEQGITGTPEEGTQVYDEFSAIDFSYEAVDPTKPVEVNVNGTTFEGSGTLTVHRDMEIAVRFVDLRGTWEFTLDNGSYDDIVFQLVIDGATPFSGTVDDSRWPGINDGEWKIEGEVLSIEYNENTDWNDYNLKGSVRSMNGTYYLGETSVDTWKATRI